MRRARKTISFLLVLKAIVIAVILATQLAASGVSLQNLIKHYPTVSIANSAGCHMNWDIHWFVTDPNGKRTIETRNWSSAFYELVSCD